MIIKIVNRLYGSIKNENDMLGFLIFHMSKNNDIKTELVLEESGMDSVSADILLKQLKDSYFIIYTYDAITVTSLGKNNYKSIFHKAAMWLLVLLKFAVSYTLGILSGVLIAYFIFKLGIPT